MIGEKSKSTRKCTCKREEGKQGERGKGRRNPVSLERVRAVPGVAGVLHTEMQQHEDFGGAQEAGAGRGYL